MPKLFLPLSVIEKYSTLTSVFIKRKEANIPVGICYFSSKHSKSFGLNVVVQFKNQGKRCKVGLSWGCEMGYV